MFAQQQYQQHIDQLVLEKEDLVRRHTIESAELRKKNAVLTEQMQRLESTAMSTAPSSTGFSADFSEFDGLTMNSWDDFSISNDFSLEHGAHQQVPATSSVMTAKNQLQQSQLHQPQMHQPQQELQQPKPGEDKAVTSSLLLMLLLCGAWVISRGPKSGSEVLPTVSEEMQTASAAVLQNLYRDSGISLGFASEQTSSQQLGPRRARSTLDSLQHRLIQPSDQQLHDQAFALTPTQYNELTSGVAHYPPTVSVFEAEGVPTVGEALAGGPGAAGISSSGPSSPGGGAADSYTRSVLKGRVSADVLKEFARMVAVTKQNLGPQLKNEPVD